MEFPRVAVVGAFKYRLRRSTAALRKHEAEEGSPLAGYTRHINQDIIVRAGMAHDQTADTLLHEILHAIFHVANVGLPYKREEKIISRITPVLLDVIRDNPHVLDFLQEQQQQ